MPIVERKIIKDEEYGWDIEVEKWRCPVCENKELPFLDARRSSNNCIRQWNNIAQMKNYHKHTLDYNIYGVCMAKPLKLLEWRKKDNWIKVNIYYDNGMYYYCYDYWYKEEGKGTGLWIGDMGFSTMAAAKRHAVLEICSRKKDFSKIVETLLLTYVQGELLN
jgi:hypothetical protein